MTIVLNGTTGITSPAETVGSTITYADTGILATYASSNTSYNQVILQNSNSGTASSTDVIVSNDQGTASTYYGDFGMNSSGWTGSLPFSAANVVYLTSTSGPLSLGSVTSNPVYIATNSTTAVTIDTSQNVGIGTSSPSSYNSPFVVSTTNSSNTIAYFENKQSASGLGEVVLAAPNRPAVRFHFITSNDSNGYFNYDTGAFKWFNNVGGSATQSMTLDSSGNLLVGATTNATTGHINVTATSGALNGVGVYCTTTASTGAVVFWNSNGQVGAINVSGTATAYVTSSDYRLKNTVTPMTGALAKVSALKPVTYKWNVDNSDGEGFIAHELAEVCPHAVTGQKDAVDEKGNPIYQGIDTSFLVATLTAAIQELNATITDLQAKLKSAGVAGF